MLLIVFVLIYIFIPPPSENPNSITIFFAVNCPHPPVKCCCIPLYIPPIMVGCPDQRLDGSLFDVNPIFRNKMSMPKIKIFNNQCRYIPSSPGYNGIAISPRRSMYLYVGGTHRLLLYLRSPFKQNGIWWLVGNGNTRDAGGRRSIQTPRSNATAEKTNRNHEWEVQRRVMVGGSVVIMDSASYGAEGAAGDNLLIVFDLFW